MKIKKGDTILVISGIDRTKTGKVLKVLPKQDSLLVEGINFKKKHLRPKRSGEKGQIVQVPGPLPVSDVKLICSKCGKAARTGFRQEKGKKYRFCKKCGQAT